MIVSIPHERDLKLLVKVMIPSMGSFVNLVSPARLCNFIIPRVKKIGGTVSLPVDIPLHTKWMRIKSVDTGVEECSRVDIVCGQSQSISSFYVSNVSFVKLLFGTMKYIFRSELGTLSKMSFFASLYCRNGINEVLVSKKDGYKKTKELWEAIPDFWLKKKVEKNANFKTHLEFNDPLLWLKKPHEVFDYLMDCGDNKNWYDINTIKSYSLLKSNMIFPVFMSNIRRFLPLREKGALNIPIDLALYYQLVGCQILYLFDTRRSYLFKDMKLERKRAVQELNVFRLEIDDVAGDLLLAHRNLMFKLRLK